jgi:hypothetical protein
MDDDTISEEYAKDASIVGYRCDRPPPSFHIGRNIFVGYFLVVYYANGNLRPF